MRIDISVILAVYNGELSILNVLNSLSKQTLSNFEVIIINDGSSDSTRSICEMFCAKDSRFKLISKDNGGVASARNIGVQNALGNFIIHHDSDDSMPCYALESLLRVAIDSGSDIVMGDYIVKHGKTERLINQYFKGDSNELIQGLLDNNYHGALWNKLIKSDLYKGLSFCDDVNYMEDKLILIKILLKDPKIVYVPTAVYTYIQHDKSITSKMSDKSFKDMVFVVNSIIDLFKKHQINFDTDRLLLSVIFNAIRYNKKADHDEIYENLNKSILSNRHFSFPVRLLLYLDSKGISLFSILYRKISSLKN